MTTALLIVAAGFVALAGLAAQRRWRRVRAIGQRLLVSYGALVLLLAVGEAYFRFFYAAPEGRLASNNWMARYWHTNSAGFRDRDWQEADWRDRTTIAVVGDSFTAGWGIVDPADRFTDVLAQRLGDANAVFNLGVPGASTPEEQRTLAQSPDPAPDVVILQYFLNDIEYAVLTLGLQPADTAPSITHESYLADFIYSRFTVGFDPGYWTYEYDNYDNVGIWSVHQQEINAFIDHVDGIGARLVVVIFPNMQDPVRSIAYVDRVTQVFEARGQHDILKLYDEVAAWSPQEVIVSPRDGHPSAAFHHRVGDLLYERFFAPES